MDFFHFIARTILDMAGQLIAGLGFIIFLGSIVAQIWILAVLGVIMMGLGFLMMRS